ncbi:MAG: hypothetical protein QXF14_04135, partial [Candidatus Woesearchaeota archaeon]
MLELSEKAHQNIAKGIPLEVAQARIESAKEALASEVLKEAERAGAAAKEPAAAKLGKLDSAILEAASTELDAYLKAVEKEALTGERAVLDETKLQNLRKVQSVLAEESERFTEMEYLLEQQRSISSKAGITIEGRPVETIARIALELKGLDFLRGAIETAMKAAPPAPPAEAPPAPVPVEKPAEVTRPALVPGRIGLEARIGREQARIELDPSTKQDVVRKITDLSKKHDNEGYGFMLVDATDPANIKYVGFVESEKVLPLKGISLTNADNAKVQYNNRIVMLRNEYLPKISRAENEGRHSEAAELERELREKEDNAFAAGNDEIKNIQRNMLLVNALELYLSSGTQSVKDSARKAILEGKLYEQVTKGFADERFKGLTPEQITDLILSTKWEGISASHQIRLNPNFRQRVRDAVKAYTQEHPGVIIQGIGGHNHPYSPDDLRHFVDDISRRVTSMMKEQAYALRDKYKQTKSEADHESYLRMVDGVNRFIDTVEEHKKAIAQEEGKYSSFEPEAVRQFILKSKPFIMDMLSREQGKPVSMSDDELVDAVVNERHGRSAGATALSETDLKTFMDYGIDPDFGFSYETSEGARESVTWLIVGGEMKFFKLTQTPDGKIVSEQITPKVEAPAPAEVPVAPPEVAPMPPVAPPAAIGVVRVERPRLTEKQAEAWAAVEDLAARANDALGVLDIEAAKIAAKDARARSEALFEEADAARRGWEISLGEWSKFGELRDRARELDDIIAGMTTGARPEGEFAPDNLIPGLGKKMAEAPRVVRLKGVLGMGGFGIVFLADVDIPGVGVQEKAVKFMSEKAFEQAKGIAPKDVIIDFFLNDVEAAKGKLAKYALARELGLPVSRTWGLVSAKGTNYAYMMDVVVGKNVFDLTNAEALAVVEKTGLKKIDEVLNALYRGIESGPNKGSYGIEDIANNVEFNPLTGGLGLVDPGMLRRLNDWQVRYEDVARRAEDAESRGMPDEATKLRSELEAIALGAGIDPGRAKYASMTEN